MKLQMTCILLSVTSAWMPANFQQRFTCQLSPLYSKTPKPLDRFPDSMQVSNRSDMQMPLEKSTNGDDTTQAATRRSWNESLKLLQEYKARHGDCNVPHRYKDDLVLARWVMLQRKRHDKLLNKHKQALDDLGFDWSEHTSWDEMFEKLKAYRSEHGDCNVPTNWTNDPALARWIVVQRSHKDKLPLGKHLALDAIGFSWNRHETKWNGMYQKLAHYKQVHGDCRVPARLKEDRSLARWVGMQRTLHSKGKLRADRLERLKHLGFAWNAKKPTAAAAIANKTPDKPSTEPPWLSGYFELLSFYREYGHCDVPESYTNVPWLAAWTGVQRQLYNANKLKPTRRDMLNRMRFSWHPVNGISDVNGEYKLCNE